MKDLETTFIQNQKLVYSKYANEFFAKKQFAGDLRHVINKSFAELDDVSHQYISEIKGFNFQSKMHEIENYIKEDKRVTLNEALNKSTESLSESEKIYMLEVLSTIKGFREFNSLLRDEEDDLREGVAVQSDLNTKKPKINWTNGNNKNDFVKIIYAMHKAGLINNGFGDITKIVESLSYEFNVGLGKGWQSNFSKSKNYQNAEFDSCEIFERLKASFKEYLEENHK